MKPPVLPILVKPTAVGLLLIASAIVAGGCGRQPTTATANDSSAQATLSPTASPTPVDKTERARQTADQALVAASELLKEKGQQAQEKLRQLADDFPRQREEWRRRLEEKQRELQPKIEDLKRRAREAGERAQPEIQRQLDNLERESQRAGQRLEELGRAGAEGWDKFQERLQRDETERSREENTPPPAEASPR